MSYFFLDWDLDAILDATDVEKGEQPWTPKYGDVGVLSDNERSESMVDRRSENS
jgi:hypothetical protein